MSTTLDTTQEVWKSIEEYPYYEVSDFGNVRSIGPPGRVLKRTLRAKSGDLAVTLRTARANGTTYYRQLSVAKLVARAFLIDEPTPRVGYKDGNKLNCCAANLAYAVPYIVSVHGAQNIEAYMRNRHEKAATQRYLDEQNAEFVARMDADDAKYGPLALPAAAQSEEPATEPPPAPQNKLTAQDLVASWQDAEDDAPQQPQLDTSNQPVQQELTEEIKHTQEESAR